MKPSRGARHPLPRPSPHATTASRRPVNSLECRPSIARRRDVPDLYMPPMKTGDDGVMVSDALELEIGRSSDHHLHRAEHSDGCSVVASNRHPVDPGD